MTIVGAFSAAKRSLSAHDAWAIRLVFFAGLITILHKAGVPVPYYVAAFGVCLGIAALLYEMNATTFALRALWNGRPLSAFGWGFVWLVAFAYSMNQWVGAASQSEGEKTNKHNAAFTATVDTKAVRDSAKSAYDQAMARKAFIEGGFEVNGTRYPVRTAKAAQADLDNAKAHRFWGVTNECKETKGPQTRDFCNGVARWKSEKELAGELEILKAELPGLKADYDKAQNAVNTTKVETSADRGDMLILTKYGNMKPEDAQALTAVGSIIAISIFLSVATALRELEHLRAQGPRQKAFRIRGWVARLRRMWDGKLEDELAAKLARDGKIEINQSLEDNRHLPEAAKLIADLTAKYRSVPA